MKSPFLTETQLIEKFNEKKIVLSPLLKLALEQAKKSHINQKRDDGSPYLTEHIYPIVEDLINSFGDKNIPEEILVGALLHDVLEDDETMTEERFINLFGKKIFDIVKPLTKSKEDNVSGLPEKKEKSISKKVFAIISKANKTSKLIKLADKANNLQSSTTIKTTKPQKYKRHIEDIEEMYLSFAEKESPYFYRRLKEILVWIK